MLQFLWKSARPVFLSKYTVSPLALNKRTYFIMLNYLKVNTDNDCAGFSHSLKNNNCASLHASRLCQSYFETSRFYAKKAKAGKKGSSQQPKIELTQDELSEVIDFGRYKDELEEVVAEMKQAFSEQLTLRTSAGALDNLMIDTPDGKFLLIQLAQIIQKNPSLYVIDLNMSPQYLPSVKQAIEQSSLNINPQQEKNAIFAAIPKVTREHRQTMAKQAKTSFNSSKDKMSHIYKNYMKKLKSEKSNHSADLIKNLEDHMLSTMKSYTAEAETIMKSKQDELLNTS